MEEISLAYYFNHIEEDFILPKIFENIQFPWEAVGKSTVFLSTMTESKINAKVHESVVIRGDVEIGEGTIIDPFVVIDGPVVIGKDCYIRPHSYIRKNTIISDRVLVGHGVEVKNSLIFSDCKLDSHSFVGDSVFGRGVRNGSGTLTANRRFDQKDIIIHIMDNTFETEFDKLGCVVGDYTRIGANCTILPGVMIGQHSFIYPQSLCKGFVPKDTYLKNKQTQSYLQKERLILKNQDKNGNV